MNIQDQVLNTLQARILELVKNEQVQAHLETLKSDQEKEKYLFFAAAATLIGKDQVAEMIK